ncbi:MAG: complex I NDUFA9 subunit family protein [Phycisphaerae bacterium]
MTSEAQLQPGDEAQREPEEPPFLTRVFITGGSGFVGRAVVRELVARGHKPVCLVRDRRKLLDALSDVPEDRYEIICGDLFDADALFQAADGAEAAIHLVGIIIENPLRNQTFRRIHVEGTERVLNACAAAGIRRYVHMSALGTRPGATSRYHQTKWIAENLVREGDLDWTIFRPSLIHGPDGEFMRMMRSLLCDATVRVLGFVPCPLPVIPYFGDGQRRVQPVSVRDVAACFAAALSRPETIGQIYELGGPEAMSWKELFRTCRDLMPGAKHWKPMLGQPVWAAKVMAQTVMRLPILPRMLRFNTDQVEMSQEDSICDIEPVERTFGVKMRDFREELAAYAARIT